MKKEEGLCDSFCRGCVHYAVQKQMCDYILNTGHSRPCLAGKGCIVRETKRKKKPNKSTGAWNLI